MTGRRSGLTCGPGSSPGEPRQDAASARDRRYVWHPWSPIDQPAGHPLLLSRGEGYHVWDTDGIRYVDAISSAFSSSCGYGHPALIDAAARQLARLPHFDLSVGGHEPSGVLAERLAQLLPGELNRTFFANSGSEATELAVRIAINYWTNRNTPRRRIVSFANGYHGATALAQALSGLPATLPDLPIGLPVTHVKLPHDPATLRRPEGLPGLVSAFANALADQHGPSDVAAVIVEPLLNVGGGVVLPSGFLRELRRLCDDAGTLLILDEVFTGFGRTGAMFGFEPEGIVPDIVMMSKGISGGYIPLSAVTTKDSIYEVFRRDPAFGGLRYGHTTSGHAVACAVGTAALDVLHSEELVANSAARGAQLIDGLKELAGLPGIVDIRGRGLVAVLETDSADHAARLSTMARKHGVLVRCQGNAVVAVPSLIIDEAGVDELLAGVARAGREFGAELTNRRRP